MEDDLIAVMGLLHHEDGLSDHRVCKRLGLRLSQLNRLLAILASIEVEGGLGWVHAEDDGRRRRLWLTEAGRSLCQQC
jgi:hypothetical protein